MKRNSLEKRGTLRTSNEGAARPCFCSLMISVNVFPTAGGEGNSGRRREGRERITVEL
jgi:hypothetical protein